MRRLRPSARGSALIIVLWALLLLGMAVFGVVVSLIWFPIAWVLGKRYETARSAESVKAAPATV